VNSPRLQVSFVPVLKDGQVCPDCSAPVTVLKKEDFSELARVGAAVPVEPRFYVDPCGHRVAVRVETFGAELIIEKFQP
jgi:hypothetical protein